MAIEGLGISVMCVTWVFTALSIMIISGRIYTRTRLLKKITIDDYLVVFTLVGDVPAVLLHRYQPWLHFPSMFFLLTASSYCR